MDLQIIQSKIYEIRGCRVMLDSDLAALYQVETKALKQAVKRNIERFPEDFMFELTKEEVECLRSQIVTLKNNPDETEEETSSKRGKHTKYLPYVFTQEGSRPVRCATQPYCHTGEYFHHAGICSLTSNDNRLSGTTKAY